MSTTYIITHTIPFKPGVIDEARKLFEEKVPPLAQRFAGWRGARMTIDRETNTVSTIGTWDDADDMKAFLAQPEFAAAMQGFSQYFAGPPTETITELVTEVGPSAASR